MRHKLLTERALFCIGVNAKKGMLSQHFVTHVVPPLGFRVSYRGRGTLLLQKKLPHPAHHSGIL